MSFPYSRSEFPILDRWTYLDTPYEGLIPRSGWEQVKELVEQDFGQDLMRDKQWRYDLRDSARAAIAEALNVPTQQAAPVTGFSAGLRQTLVHLMPRKKVILIEDDYPTLMDAFSTGAFDVHLVPREQDGSFSLDDLDFAMKKCRGGVFAFSHVWYVNGYRVDPASIGPLAQQYDITTVIDLTQSFATMPIDASATGIDIHIASTYKWLSSGFGNGFVCSGNDRKELLRVIDQLNTGHLDPWAMIRMRSALAKLNELDPAHIWKHIDALNDLLREGLAERGVEVFSSRAVAHRSALLQFAGDEGQVKVLWKKKVRTSFRGNGIRVGPHWYNTEKDIDVLLNAF